MHFTDDKGKLKKVLDTWKDTLAHLQARHNWITEDPDILKLKNSWGTTVAHIQAEKGWTTEDKDILSICNNYKCTIVKKQIKQGWIPPEHLKDVKINGETIWDIYCRVILEAL